MPSTSLRVLYVNLVLTTTVCGRDFYDPHFIGGDTDDKEVKYLVQVHTAGKKRSLGT